MAAQAAAAIPDADLAHIAEPLRQFAVPIKSLKHDKENLKLHGQRNLDVIKASLERFGQYLPLVVQRKGMVVRVGNGRLTVAKQLGWKYVAALVVDDDKVDAVARALLDNRSGELGQWDAARLAAVIAGLRSADADDAVAQAWTADELRLIVAAGSANGDAAAKPIVEDVPPEPPAAPVTRSGDLWLLGDHRLLCGDSTVAADVARVMGGEGAGLMNTDPPYGVGYANDERPNPGVAKPRVAKPRVANDRLIDEALQAFLEQVFRNATGCALTHNAAWYLWHAHLTQGYFAAAAAAAANVVLHRQIIWVKPVLLLGRGHYHWKHEPCFMGWVEGHQPPDYGHGNGERTQTTVWEIASVTQAERKEFNHSTPKPVGLFATPIIKHLKPGEICFEPFAGSGPQIIAAEQLSRRCFAIEIAPAYVDVCCLRWAKLTGREPTLEGTGQTFAAVRAERQQP